MSATSTDVHVWLSSKAAALVSWVSAALGIGTAIGIVNLTVGILSACWLSAQLWNFMTYTLPRNKREKEKWKREDMKSKQHE